MGKQTISRKTTLRKVLHKLGVNSAEVTPFEEAMEKILDDFGNPNSIKMDRIFSTFTGKLNGDKDE